MENSRCLEQHHIIMMSRRQAIVFAAFLCVGVSMCFASAPHSVPPSESIPLKNLYDMDYYILTRPVLTMWHTMVDYSRSMVSAAIPVYVARPTGTESQTPKQTQAGTKSQTPKQTPAETEGGDSGDEPPPDTHTSKKDTNMFARLYEWRTWMCQALEKGAAAANGKPISPLALKNVQEDCYRLCVGYVLIYFILHNLTCVRTSHWTINRKPRRFGSDEWSLTPSFCHVLERFHDVETREIVSMSHGKRGIIFPIVMGLAMYLHPLCPFFVVVPVARYYQPHIPHRSPWVGLEDKTDLVFVHVCDSIVA